MQNDERRVAVGGVQYSRAGCLLAPFIPLRVAGALVVTTRRVIFEPILHYKLVTRKFDLDLDEVTEADATGRGVQVNPWDLIAIGKTLTLKMRSGASYVFRSMDAEQLADAIDGEIRRRKG